MTEAVLLSTTEKPILRFQRFLPRPVAEVWRAVTDPGEMRAWFPTRVDIDRWEAGATFTHHFDNDAKMTLPGRVLEVDAPHRLVFTWGENVIGFELTATEGGTTFVLTDTLSAPHAARNAAGWEVCLERLVSGTVGEDWSSRFRRYSAAYEPVLGPQDGPPTAQHD